MSETMIVAIISLCGTMVGTFGGIIASNKLVEYRLKQLEDKVNKHNQVVERTFRLEGRMEEAEHNIRDLKGEMNRA